MSSVSLSILAEPGDARLGVWGIRIQKANALCFWRRKLGRLEKLLEEMVACHQEISHRLWDHKGVDAYPDSSTYEMDILGPL